MLATAHVATPFDTDYAQLENLIAAKVATAQGPLFTTDADGVFTAYLVSIPEEHRQHYNCHCCRRFLTNYGGLVNLEADGSVVPLLWSEGDVPAFFRDTVSALYRLVRKAKVTGVFVNGDVEWGTKQTGTWTHLHGTPPAVFRNPIKTADQASAEKLQDYIILRKALEDYSKDAAAQAVRVLRADAVDRSEKTLGVAEWFLNLHISLVDKRSKVRDNIVWRTVATAPPGWCHIRSTMIATLLDDILEGLTFEAIKARWDAKMHPLRYQRPVAPPKDGTIEQANKIVAQLQSAGALERRFARLEEVVALWKPTLLETPAKPQGGAFDHLKAKSSVKEVELPPQKMTWEKFRESVLPEAATLAVLLPHGNTSFYGMTTAVNADAPPLLQWDGTPRNPVAWYFYHGGSPAHQWGLTPGWCSVDAVCLMPCHWYSDQFAHQGKGVFLVLQVAHDTRESGSALFPETLRAEYHGIRSVMEAYSRNAKLQGVGTANGIALTGEISHRVRVKSKDGSTQNYLLSL